MLGLMLIIDASGDQVFLVRVQRVLDECTPDFMQAWIKNNAHGFSALIVTERLSLFEMPRRCLLTPEGAQSGWQSRENISRRQSEPEPEPTD